MKQHARAGCCKCGRMHYDSFDRLGRYGMERGHHIDIRNVAYFHHVYDSEQPDMRRLYEQAKIDQWNAATDIDWEQPLDGDGGLIADDLVDIHGTKFWDRLSETQRVELNRCVSRWRISTLMAGEHGAMLVCSQLVENVVGQDAKLFQATQVVDEARHNEVLHRYVKLRLDGETYPLAGNVREIFDTLLGTSAWYLKTIGLQLVAETFAVSLFRMLAEFVERCDPAPGMPAHPAGRSAPYGVWHAVTAGGRRRGVIGGTARDGRLRGVGIEPHLARHFPTRRL